VLKKNIGGVLSLFLAMLLLILIISLFAINASEKFNIYVLLPLSTFFALSSIGTGAWGIKKKSGLCLAIIGIIISLCFLLFLGFIIVWFSFPGGGPFGP